MTASFINDRVKLAVLSSLLAAMFSLSAHAGLYPYSINYSSSPPPIPQGGLSLTPAPQITVSGLPSVISSVEIILTFNDNSSLTGNSSSGIQGLLDLGTLTTSPSVSFSPTGTPVSGSQERTYELISSDFNNLNPNNTWVLDLWDNTSLGSLNYGIENGLVSWTLDITAVPEPVGMALVLFAGLAGLWWCLGACWKKRESPDAASAEPESSW